ncbi:MAG TPA: glycosyltransferase family 39 protein [Candidatus Acidoferrum sp.]|nr:glycosyltransferase family 39 protein [Candidatus Acidoferrum sp.]
MHASSEKTRQQNLAAACASVIAVIVCLFGNLGAIGLLGPDEPRYAWIARAMADSGDWVTPRLYGQPWFEKPVLYYWAAAIGFRVPLSSEWAARLPSAVAALAAAITISWLAWNFFEPLRNFFRGPALFAPLLFSTTVAAIGFSRAATPDMLFSAFLAIAMAFAAAILLCRGALAASNAYNPSVSSANSKNTSLLLIGWGASLGAAVLAKGPAAILLAGGAILLWVIVSRDRRSAFRLAHPLAIAACLLVALPWYVLCSLRNPDFLRVFIWQHNFERYLTPLFMHRQPFWFFGPIFLLALLPWTVLLWPAALLGINLWRKKSWQKSPGCFFVCWTLFPILFFSLSQSKLPSYVLPSIAPACLLLAAAFFRFARSEAGTLPVFRLSVASVGLTWIFLAIAALFWLHRVPASERTDLHASLLPLALLAFAGGVAVFALAFFRPRASVYTSVFFSVLCIAIAGHNFLPALDPYVSARPHALLFTNSHFPNRIFTYQLPRSWDYGLAFYFDRKLPEWSPADPEAAILLTTPKGLEEVKQQRRFSGPLEETYRGVLLVPVLPAARDETR